MSQIESTYKARDVEEAIDRAFYRPIGYSIARLSRFLALSPNVITIISIVVGVIAGHLFYYSHLAINVVGMILLVGAEAMDSADGQLARMTKSYSRFGRILDGVGGNLIFVSIYLNLCLRIVHEGGPLWVFLVAILSGVSHSFQCAMADYYRNAYLYFVYGEHRSELDKAATVAREYSSLPWRKDPLRKFLMRFYVNYTYQQEFLAVHFQRLYAAARQAFGEHTPEWLRRAYALHNKPLLKYYNFITTNTRMIALFVSLLLQRVILYFAFELIVLNAVLVYVTLRQERLNREMCEAIERGTA